MNSQQEQMIAMAGFSGQQMQGMMQGLDGGAPPENPAKELFSKEGDIRLKTDLNADEIGAIALLNYYGKLTKSPKIKVLLADFMHLRASIDRKSRKEFVGAVTGQDSYARQGNMFSRMFNK